MLLEHLTGITYTERLVKDSPLTAEQELQLGIAKELLLKGVPIQHITQTAHFMGADYFVNEHVLIPRPETEELVQWIADEHKDAELTILDIGTGSGCIPISLKQLLPRAAITSIDVGADALKVAERNAATNNADVTFILLDFLNTGRWKELPTFDVIVSNPPYIPISEKEKLDKNVRDYETGTALFVPDNDALLFYRHIAQFGQTHLTVGGYIYCEVHQDYAADTLQMFDEEGYKTSLRKDMFGNERMIQAKK